MVYIQSDSERKLPHHFDVACAMYGAMDSNQDFRLTSFEEVASGKFDALIRKNLFVGSTEFMREVFKRIGLEDVGVPMNSNRECKIITLGQAMDIAKTGKKIFIKPVEIKLFTGFVLDQMEHVSISKVSLDTLVMAYEPFKDRIWSEWRIYVHNGTMVDSRNYAGDFTKSPNYDIVRHAIKHTIGLEFPVAYTIDMGILENGENVVIEYNDMWAIGNYGIPNEDYFRLLRNRYFEITKI